MQEVTVVVLVALLCTVMCKPMDLKISDAESQEVQHHNVRKRFVNQMFALGGAADSSVTKMRTRRGAGDECEKLKLCELHARSQHSFFSTFQLYFVNKENARLWDHHARSIAACQQRYGDCYEY